MDRLYSDHIEIETFSFFAVAMLFFLLITKHNGTVGFPGDFTQSVFFFVTFFDKEKVEEQFFRIRFIQDRLVNILKFWHEYIKNIDIMDFAICNLNKNRYIAS